jgi:hypothetical protein
MRLIFKENMRLRKVVALKNNNGHSEDENAKLQFVEWRDGERMVLSVTQTANRYK